MSREAVTIGVVSDTHLPRFGRQLPKALVDGLRSARVQRIVHCGDHTSDLAVTLLEEIAPVDAVAGNNDGPDIVARFDWKTIVRIGRVRIGLVHGDQGPGRTTPERALRSFSGDSVDVICFGHSHQPYLAHHNGILLLNPGSPTDRRFEKMFSYAVLKLGAHEPGAEIHRFATR